MPTDWSLEYLCLNLIIAVAGGSIWLCRAVLPFATVNSLSGPRISYDPQGARGFDAVLALAMQSVRLSSSALPEKLVRHQMTSAESAALALGVDILRLGANRV